jgi:hypothetical protein
MCSNASRSGAPTRPEPDLATRLAAAIDELAAAADSQVDADKDGTDQDNAPAGTTTGQDMAERLARAWAMIAAADPEMAARTARYSRP